MLVSIVIPTFGRPENLKRAILSVLSQSYTNIEVIVVDDNNPDSPDRESTSNIVSEFSNVIKYICHPENMNGSAARNTGVLNSSGKYIAFLDDDDEFKVDRIEQHLSFVKNNKCHLSYCLSEFKVAGKHLYNSSYCRNGNISTDILCSSIELNSSTLLITRELYDNVGGFDETFTRNQDFEFILSCLMHEEIKCLKNVLVVRNIDSQSNQLGYTEYYQVRKSFFNKFDYMIRELKFWDKVNVKSMFHLDLAFYALRKKRLFSFLKHFIRILPTGYVISNIYKKVSKKL